MPLSPKSVKIKKPSLTASEAREKKIQGERAEHQKGKVRQQGMGRLHRWKPKARKNQEDSGASDEEPNPGAQVLTQGQQAK